MANRMTRLWCLKEQKSAARFLLVVRQTVIPSYTWRISSMKKKQFVRCVDSINALDTEGTIKINGATFTLEGVETVAGAVGNIACFGMDYRMNKASDGCSARSQSEKDAIQWHRDNPGVDGRLPRSGELCGLHLRYSPARLPNRQRCGRRTGCRALE